MTPFGTPSDGREVHAIDIATGEIEVRILTYGAVINDVRVGGLPMTLGSPDIAAYEGPLASFGSLMGPVVNRIRGASAEIAGDTYQFEANFEGAHTLHSGRGASHEQVWSVEAQTADSVTLALALPDGLGGFPGNRNVRVTYTVAGTSLTMAVEATTDAATLFSFANHSYWSLDGAVGYAGHTLTIPAETYLEAGPDLMPTGQRVPVEGTAYDARNGLTLTADDTQFFDLNYCIAEAHGPLREIARLRSPEGREMVMESTTPGLQVYDCGTINGAGFATHHGQAYSFYAGVALEAQLWPGAAHDASFPSIRFGPGETYAQTTRWSFSV